jgi:hypothetical protein
MAAGLQRLQRLGAVDMDDRVELVCGAGVEVVAAPVAEAAFGDEPLGDAS